MRIVSLVNKHVPIADGGIANLQKKKQNFTAYYSCSIANQITNSSMYGSRVFPSPIHVKKYQLNHPAYGYYVPTILPITEGGVKCKFSSKNSLCRNLTIKMEYLNCTCWLEFVNNNNMKHLSIAFSLNNWCSCLKSVNILRCYFLLVDSKYYFCTHVSFHIDDRVLGYITSMVNRVQ
ncbi:hypothetical protein AGLY_002963 [Aphis glycines]|uniref:Uncharacterized protein n=1 Tax=Aphis glycines TaxID=307491 RepID=A0A6G0U440_APHGL|nr:hypothetical protein AGLY_002963 [Aphis glycines]